MCLHVTKAWIAMISSTYENRTDLVLQHIPGSPGCQFGIQHQFVFDKRVRLSLEFDPKSALAECYR